jgi:hypothetical protein
MVMTEMQIWLHDYTWIVVASCSSHENHVFT